MPFMYNKSESEFFLAPSPFDEDNFEAEHKISIK